MPYTKINKTEIHIAGEFLTFVQGDDVVVLSRSETNGVKTFLDFEDF